MTNHEERDDVIVLTDDEGKEYEFELIHLFELDGLRYAALSPLSEEEPGEDGDLIIMRLEADEKTGEDLLVDIEDDADWEKVAAEWERICDEEAEYDDEDDDEGEDEDEDEK